MGAACGQLSLATDESSIARESHRMEPFTLQSGQRLIVGDLSIALQTDGNLVVEQGWARGAYLPLWGSSSYRPCDAGACSAQFDELGQLTLAHQGDVYWRNSALLESAAATSSPDPRTLEISNRFPYLAILQGERLAWSPALGPTFQPDLTRRGPIGYITEISPADGVVRGFAVDLDQPETTLTIEVFADALDASGHLVASAPAAMPSPQLLYDTGVRAPHGFAVTLPAELHGEQARALFVRAVRPDGTSFAVRGVGTDYATILPRRPASVAADATCLDPNTTCATSADDLPTYTPGWSDGRNYFNEWQCASTTGINTIARLQIAPIGTHGTQLQKDSLYVNGVDSLMGNPVVYFTNSRYNTSSTVYSLKKAAFDGAGWRIFDVLDTPSSKGGVSSQDGRGVNIIMNDYAQPGWGPTSPLPGESTLVPAVEDIPSNPEGTSYALWGHGPRGLTMMRNMLGNTTTSGGPEGRTCIHMNPKLFDYDANGVPHSMLAYLWQDRVDQPCNLPEGGRLPKAAYYIYRHDPTRGWQLDLEAGPISQDVRQDQAVKLMMGHERTFIAGNWQGQITTLNLDDPAPRQRQTILDCGLSGAQFGEATGNEQFIWFMANPPGATKINPSGNDDVWVGDIYFAFKNGL